MTPNPRLAPYLLKIKTLNIGDALYIPKSAFSHWPPKVKERAMSDGPKVWVMIAHGEKMEVRRIE